MWTNYHTPDLTLSQKPANKLRLAAWWPVHIDVDPVAVGASAVGAYLVTGSLPWQLDGFSAGARWYLIAGVLYYFTLELSKADAELKYIESHLPTWVKTAVGV
jgi:hypothetical protein